MTSLRSRINQSLSSLSSFKTSQIAFTAFSMVVLARLAAFVVRAPFIEGDTTLLVNNHINAIRTCIGERRFSGCPGSGVFPLLQNVPGLVLNYLGLSSNAVLHLLAYL